jgi:predicted AAA+ superfamily ATPase
MAHIRKRHIASEIQQQGKFWPVVGLLGLRQSGKSTLLREILGIERYASLDDESSLEDALLSGKNFLVKLGTPAVIDEVQKAPRLFDAIKLKVDLSRRPGGYFLTGSSQFSSKIGIRESLTGRIGLTRVYPFTLAEAHELPLMAFQGTPWSQRKSRFRIDEAMKRLGTGGLQSTLSGLGYCCSQKRKKKRSILSPVPSWSQGQNALWFFLDRKRESREDRIA